MQWLQLQNLAAKKSTQINTITDLPRCPEDLLHSVCIHNCLQTKEVIEGTISQRSKPVRDLDTPNLKRSEAELQLSLCSGSCWALFASPFLFFSPQTQSSPFPGISFLLNLVKHEWEDREELQEAFGYLTGLCTVKEIFVDTTLCQLCWHNKRSLLNKKHSWGYFYTMWVTRAFSLLFLHASIFLQYSLRLS